MSPFAISTAAFLLTAAAAALGVVLRSRLPEQHLSGDSRDTVRVGVGLLATLTALVLGLVTASAKSSFDNMDGAMRHMAAELITLDRDGWIRVSRAPMDYALAQLGI